MFHYRAMVVTALSAPSKAGLLFGVLMVGVGAATLVVVSGQPVLAALSLPLAALAVVVLANPVAALCVYAASIPLESAFSTSDVGTVARVMGLALLLSVSLYWLRRRAVVSPRRLHTLAWALLLYALLSLTWAAEPQVGRFLTLLQLIVSALLVADVVATHRSAFKFAMYTYCVVAAGTATLALLEFAERSAVTAIRNPRSAAFDEQSVAHFAAQMMPAFLYALSKALADRHWWHSLPFALVAIVTLLAILASGTNSAWVGLLVAIGVLLLRQLGPTTAARAVAITAAGVLVLGSIPQLAEFVQQRAVYSVESGGSGRATIWQVGWTIAAQNAPLGAGFGMFPRLFNQQAIDATWGLAQAPPTGRVAHNIYLGLLAELGVTGLVLWALWMRSLLASLTRVRTHAFVAVTAILAAYLVQGIFLDILAYKYMFFAIGLAEGLHRLRKEAYGRHA